jgi:shikimate 5-dehydrogenase
MSRQIVLVLALGVVLGAASGCASNTDGPIDYRVTGGLGGSGDGIAMHIERNGTVTRTVYDQSPATAQLAPATLSDLLTKIDDAQFATLASEYSCSCADAYIDNISVELDGHTYSVAAQELADLPAPLQSVVDALHQIAHDDVLWK